MLAADGYGCFNSLNTETRTHYVITPCSIRRTCWQLWYTVYPKKYAHGFVLLCFVVVMQSFIMNSHEVFIHIHQGCFAGTGAIVRLPQCQWSKPEWYGKISQCITTTKHSKAKTVCIFLGIYCTKPIIVSQIVGNISLHLPEQNYGLVHRCIFDRIKIRKSYIIYMYKWCV